MGVFNIIPFFLTLKDKLLVNLGYFIALFSIINSAVATIAFLISAIIILIGNKKIEAEEIKDKLDSTSWFYDK